MDNIMRYWKNCYAVVKAASTNSQTLQGRLTWIGQNHPAYLIGCVAIYSRRPKLSEDFEIQVRSNCHVVSTFAGVR